MLISRYIIFVMLIEIMTGVFISSAWCQKSSYLDKTNLRNVIHSDDQNQENESWLQRQLREFRTYPHLDRAYRLMKNNRLAEAGNEIDKVLNMYPANWQAGLLKVILLNEQRKYADVIRQANLLLKEKSGVVLAHFYKGMAYQKLNQHNKAIEAYEQALLLANNHEEKKNILLALGEIYKGAEDWPEAEKMFSAAQEFDPENIYILRTRVELCDKQFKKEAAVALMQEVLSRNYDSRDYEYLSTLLAESGKTQQALKGFQQCLLEMKDKQDQARIWARMGYLYYQIKDRDQAVMAFQRAIENGNESTDLRQALGMVLYEQKQWQAAVMEFHRAKYEAKTPLVQLYISRCYVKLKNTRMAIYHLEEAWARYYLLTKSDKLDLFRELGYLNAENRDFWNAMKAWKKYLEIEFDPRIALDLSDIYMNLSEFDQAKKTLLSVLTFNPENKTALNELGYYFSEQREYAQAVDSWQKSLRLEYDPHIMLNIGYVQGLMKRYEDAQQTLENIPEQKLSLDEQVLLYDSLAAIYAETLEYDKALTAQSKANDLNLSPEGYYKTGLYYQKLGQSRKAVAKFRQASDADPKNSRYAKQLGYAYIRAGDDAKAIETLSRVSQMEKESFYLPKEIGYLCMKNFNNKEAAKWFSVSLERLQAVRPQTNEEREVIAREAGYLQEEIRKLNNRIDVSIYQVYRPDDGSEASASAGLGSGGALRSEGGIEVAYQPLNIGFRDERTFQIIARTFWNNDDGSLKVNEESLQGGAGFRYKPFKTANLYVGAERLWEIGDQAEDAWLIRTMYSLNSGEPAKANQEFTRYYLFYADAAYFFNDDNYGAIFTEWREGFRVRISRHWSLIPHLTISQRWQDPDPGDVTYAEGGGGILLRYKKTGNRPLSGQFQFESLIQYKAGIHNADSGLVFTNILRF